MTNDKTCPTPSKARFATSEAADRMAARYVHALKAYLCECGWHHLTSKAAVAASSLRVTEAVTVLNDVEFEAVVVGDVRGLAAPEQSAALRDPMNAERWRQVLDRLRDGVAVQLNARAGDRSVATRGWRTRAEVFRLAVKRRREEAHGVLQALHRAAGEERALMAQAGASVPELRALAGKRAVKRLIEAHNPEFGDLLVEEFGALGLIVPTYLLRHQAHKNTALVEAG